MRFHSIRQAVTAVLLVTAAAAHAQSVGISSPSHGELLLDTSAFYRPAPYYDVQVRVGIDIPSGQKSKYDLLIHGRKVKPSGKTANARVWVGPWDGPTGPPPAWYPFLGYFRDPQHIQKPIIVELVDKTSKAVVARDRIVLFDGRFDAGLNPAYGGSSVDDGMHVQLADSGLDALEETHRSSLPDPTLADFNAVLRDEVAGTTLEIETETEHGKAGNACIPLGDAPTEFLMTSAYIEAFLQAQARYLAHQQVQQSQSFLGIAGLPGVIASLTVQAYLTAECVQQQPTIGTFELCVGRVEAELTDLSTAGIRDVNLSFGAGVLNPVVHDDLLADVDLGDVDGTVEGRLRDVFIRWSERPAGCSAAIIPVPQETLSDTDLVADKDRAAWATCAGLEVDAAAAHLGPTTRGPFHVDPLIYDDNTAHFDLFGLANPELLGVNGEAGVEFTLDAARTRNPDVGTCGEDFVRAAVLELLDGFYPTIEAALGDAWDDGAAATQQARALDALFTPFELGTAEPADHQLDLEFTRLGIVDAGAVTDPTWDGFVGGLRTDAKLRSGFDVVPPPAAWVYSPPTIPLTDADPNDAVVGIASTDGRDPFGDPFDVAFGITTGMLNQVLRERSATAHLRFEWTPTWDDLGIAPPRGQRPADAARLDGTVLASAVDPAFATLGTATLAVVAQPTILPFTWIPPDPFSISPTAPPFVWGRAPFTYQLSQFLIDVYSDDPANSHPVQLAIDFYDDEFGFSFGTPGENRLVPGVGNAEWVSTALVWNVPGCDRAAMTQPAKKAPKCGGLASSALADRLIPLLEDNLLAILADVPAPLRFDAAGAGSARDLGRSDTFVGGQRVVFYGRLD